MRKISQSNSTAPFQLPYKPKDARNLPVHLQRQKRSFNIALTSTKNIETPISFLHPLLLLSERSMRCKTNERKHSVMVELTIIHDCPMFRSDFGQFQSFSYLSN